MGKQWHIGNPLLSEPSFRIHSVGQILCIYLLVLFIQVQCFIMLGSPVGLLLAFRNQMSKIPDPLNKDEQSVLNSGEE